MNELVDFARQALERLSEDRGKEPSSESTPSAEIHVPNWLGLWREFATVTHGLLSEDPRVGPVLDALAECDRNYRAADLDGFQRAAERVRRLMCFAPGATVRWEGTVNHRLTVFGPATVEHVHHDDGKLHVFVVWKGTERWVSESIITKIEGPKP